MKLVNMRLPAQLAGFVNGQRNLSLNGVLLGELFDRLDELAPMIRSQIFDDTDAIRQFVGIFVDGRQVVEPADGWKTVRCDGDVTVVMSVAGG